MLRTFIAGEDIRHGQLLYAEIADADTSEPIILVYQMVIGKTPVGLAMSDGGKDQPVSVAVSGGIMDMTLDDDLFSPLDPKSPDA